MKFTVPGPPVPKARARVVKGHAFTPEKTARYERLVKMCALTAGVRPIAGPVHMSVTLYMPDKRRRDADNCVKAISDALNGVAYEDDSQTLSGQWAIFYDKAHPRAEVTIEELRHGEALIVTKPP